MDFRYLQAFLAAVDGPTLATAAKRLHIAPSALTRQLQLFEMSVGVPLFERKTNVARPTPKALELAQQTRSYLQACQFVFHNESQQLLRIQTLEGGLVTYLQPLLTKSGIPPHIDLDIRIGSSRGIEEALRAGETDVGILSKKVQAKGLRHKLVMMETMALIFHKPIELSNIHKERWIYVFEGSYLHRLNKNEPLRTLRVESLATVLELVKAKQGLAVVPERILPEKTKLFVLPLERFRKEPMYVVWRSDLSRPLLNFIHDDVLKMSME